MLIYFLYIQYVYINSWEQHLRYDIFYFLGSFAGFRAKLNLGRFTHHSSKNQNAEPQLQGFRSKHSPTTAIHCEDKPHSIEDRNESPFLTPPEGTGETAEEIAAAEEAANEQTVTIELEEVPLCDKNEKNQIVISDWIFCNLIHAICMDDICLASKFEALLFEYLYTRY